MLPHSKLITRDERFRQINKNFHKIKRNLLKKLLLHTRKSNIKRRKKTMNENNTVVKILRIESSYYDIKDVLICFTKKY